MKDGFFWGMANIFELVNILMGKYQINDIYVAYYTKLAFFMSY